MQQLREVVIESSDTDVITKFYENFKLEMPKPLKDSIDNFKKEQSLLTQREFKKQLVIALDSLEHAELKTIFEPVLEACHKNACALQFEDDIDKMLTVDEEEKV